jgi:DNA-binding ferritin-like protein (Dps family)
MSVLDKIIGDLAAKRQYREYKARQKALPEPYRASAVALDRYLMHLGATDHTATLMKMLDDLITLLEQGAADRTPLRQLLGDDPVDFIETFLENYGRGSWIVKERDRLRRSVAEAADAEGER